MIALVIQNFTAQRRQREVNAQITNNALNQAHCLKQIRAYQDMLEGLQEEAAKLRLDRNKL